MRDIQPLVSVIVPIYRVEKYLKKCIKSIKQQTYSNLEIILVDDGSPDGCPEICDMEAQKDSRIIVIHKENGGLSSARNAGIDAAQGEYIAFVDSDDYISEKFIEILLDMCLDNEADIAQCDFLAVNEKSQTLPWKRHQRVEICSGREAVHRFCCAGDAVKYIVAWNKLYKKQLFTNIRYPLNKIHEDEFTTYKILWKAHKVAITTSYLYYYLQRKDSIMYLQRNSIKSAEFLIKRLDREDALKEQLLFMEKNNLKPEYIAVLRRLYKVMKADYKLFADDDENFNICEKISLELKAVENTIKQYVTATTEKSIYNFYSYCNLKDTKVLIYGAGKAGRASYEWLINEVGAEIVGWIDNSWYVKKNFPISISPLDVILSYEFDYIVIAIKDKILQQEIKSNLMSWKVDENKIVELDIEEQVQTI